MLFSRCQVLTTFTLCLFVRTVVHSRCGQEFCRGNQPCCAQANTTMTTYYNIAMITRKLSGILIMLLLFAVGYFVQRVLCTRSRQLAPPQDGQPDVTASQEMLMESCTPDSLGEPLPIARLPSYEACKHLPTYEETIREDNRGRHEHMFGRAT